MPLDGRSRFQVNMLVRKSDTLSQLANFKDGSILPIFWFEAVSIPSTCTTAVNKGICSQFNVTYLHFLKFSTYANMWQYSEGWGREIIRRK
jgi:hypothetical protein